ncbi:MAG TPA: YidB family protein [Gaiellaceae bacterium]|nr:YidB family protein [Gaiellaceae bacterium]
MSGLDDALGGLMGGKSGGSGGLDDVLGGLLGGGRGGGRGGGSAMGALLPVLAGLLAGGGLQKVLGGLKANGLSAQADSWVGTGTNEPVTGSQVEQAIGKEQMQQVAQQLGVSESEAAEAVAAALPEVVDKVSPEGQLPPEQDLDAAFDKLAKAGAK